MVTVRSVLGTVLSIVVYWPVIIVISFLSLVAWHQIQSRWQAIEKDILTAFAQSTKAATEEAYAKSEEARSTTDAAKSVEEQAQGENEQQKAETEKKEAEEDFTAADESDTKSKTEFSKAAKDEVDIAEDETEAGRDETIADTATGVAAADEAAADADLVAMAVLEPIPFVDIFADAVGGAAEVGLRVEESVEAGIAATAKADEIRAEGDAGVSTADAAKQTTAAEKDKAKSETETAEGDSLQEKAEADEADAQLLENEAKEDRLRSEQEEKAGLDEEEKAGLDEESALSKAANLLKDIVLLMIWLVVGGVCAIVNFILVLARLLWQHTRRFFNTGRWFGRHLLLQQFHFHWFSYDSASFLVQLVAFTCLICFWMHDLTSTTASIAVLGYRYLVISCGSFAFPFSSEFLHTFFSYKQGARCSRKCIKHVFHHSIHHATSCWCWSMLIFICILNLRTLRHTINAHTFPTCQTTGRPFYAMLVFVMFGMFVLRLLNELKQQQLSSKSLYVYGKEEIQFAHGYVPLTDSDAANRFSISGSLGMVFTNIIKLLWKAVQVLCAFAKGLWEVVQTPCLLIVAVLSLQLARIVYDIYFLAVEKEQKLHHFFRF